MKGYKKMTNEELRDILTWLYDNREALKLAADTVKTLESLLNWLTFDDLVNRIVLIMQEAQKGTYNERKTDNATI